LPAQAEIRLTPQNAIEWNLPVKDALANHLMGVFQRACSRGSRRGDDVESLEFSGNLPSQVGGYAQN